MGVQSLRLLIPSDIHDDVSAVEQLAREIAGKHVDIVLFPGDFSSMPNPVPFSDAGWKEPSEAENSEYIKKSGDVLQALKKLQPKARLFFVPGNHDPPVMFSDSPSDSESGLAVNSNGNVHGVIMELASDLVLVGWGGCVEATEGGREVWPAFPWRDAELLNTSLPRLAAQVASLPKPTRVLLLTHPGPASSSTTRVSGLNPNDLNAPGLRDNDIMSGSKFLQAALVGPDVMQERVALHLHGHTHHGAGMARLGAIPVLNPGSLRFTRTYALATMMRSDESPWTLSSYEIHTLENSQRPLSEASWQGSYTTFLCDAPITYTSIIAGVVLLASGSFMVPLRRFLSKSRHQP